MRVTELVAIVLLAGIFSAPFGVHGQASTPEEELRVDSLYDLYRHGVQAGRYDPKTHASLVVEDAFRDVLARWAAGSSSAPGELSDLQQQVIENKAGRKIDAASLSKLGSTVTRGLRRRPVPRKILPGLLCLTKIQNHTLEQIEELDPDALFPLVYLYHRAFLDQMISQPRLWLAPSTHVRIFSVLGRYLATGRDSADLTAAMLAAITYAFNSIGYYDTFGSTRDGFLDVLELEPRHPQARYWAAILEEQLGNYRKAVKHLEVLRTLWPEDLEVRLRLAINRCRNGKLEANAGELEAIARGEGVGPAGPVWIRLVAYQELGRFYEPVAAERAIGYLEEAVDRFPENAGLRLQLHYLLASVRGDFEDWTEDMDTLWGGDPGDSPRLRYSNPRGEEIEHVVERLRSEIRSRLPALAATLERLSEERRESRQQIFPECRGTLSW